MELTPKLKKKAQLLMLSERHCKAIIDLLLKGLSINDVADYMNNIEERPGTYGFIKKLVIFSGKHAKRLNGYYDSLVRDKIELLEVDEIYQGRSSMFLGVVHKYSTYLFGLEQCYGKDIETLSNKLTPYFESCHNLELVITDGLRAYGAAIKNTLCDLTHLKCHLHAYRDLMRALDPILRRSNRAYQSLKRERNKLKFYKKRLSRAKRVVNYHNKRLQCICEERDVYYRLNGISKYSKKAPWTEKRKNYKKKIESIRTYIKEYSKSINNWNNKASISEIKLLKLEEKYKLTKVDALQSSRLVCEYKRLLDCRYTEFNSRYSSLICKLRRSPYSIALRLEKVLRTNPEYFKDKSSVIQKLVPPNRANTNTVESIFGKYRLFFDHLRNIKPTKYTTALFELLRLKHNISGPYTGPNKNISPIKRLDVATHYNNYVDCLFSQNLSVA